MTDEEIRLQCLLAAANHLRHDGVDEILHAAKQMADFVTSGAPAPVGPAE